MAAYCEPQKFGRADVATTNRDDFSQGRIRVLGERAAFICSNPECRQPTIGPHSDPDKSLKTGKACHIKAAAEGGPRYDPEQTSEERSGTANGIWLCSVCSDTIDKDYTRFPVEKLLEWKANHEEWLRNGGIIPKMPEVKLDTLRGLTIPDTPGELDVSADGELREHMLFVRNVADCELLMIDARVQLAEPVVGTAPFYIPAGVHVVFDAIRPQMVAFGSAGAKVTRFGHPGPTNLYRLQIDKLPPGQHIQLGIRTSLKTWNERGINFDGPLWEGINEPPTTSHYIDAKYQFEYHGARALRPLFAPIGYDKDSRVQHLIEVLDGYGTWRPVVAEMFC
jgi:hypothetical protein